MSANVICLHLMECLSLFLMKMKVLNLSMTNVCSQLNPKGPVTCTVSPENELALGL